MLPRATPTLPGRGALWSEEPGSFLSVVRSSGARVGNTPRALEGQGQKAVRGRPIGSPSGHMSIVVRLSKQMARTVDQLRFKTVMGVRLSMRTIRVLLARFRASCGKSARIVRAEAASRVVVLIWDCVMPDGRLAIAKSGDANRWRAHYSGKSGAAETIRRQTIANSAD